MLYCNCSIYDATPISRCPRIRYFIRQESKMQIAITLSKAHQECYARKLGVLYDAVGASSTGTALTDMGEILPEKWTDTL